MLLGEGSVKGEGAGCACVGVSGHRHVVESNLDRACGARDDGRSSRGCHPSLRSAFAVLEAVGAAGAAVVGHGRTWRCGGV